MQRARWKNRGDNLALTGLKKQRDNAREDFRLVRCKKPAVPVMFCETRRTTIRDTRTIWSTEQEKVRGWHFRLWMKWCVLLIIDSISIVAIIFYFILILLLILHRKILSGIWVCFLLETFLASTPPDITFFKALPSKRDKILAIYVIVLESLTISPKSTSGLPRMHSQGFSGVGSIMRRMIRLAMPGPCSLPLWCLLLAMGIKLLIRVRLCRFHSPPRQMYQSFGYSSIFSEDYLN